MPKRTSQGMPWTHDWLDGQEALEHLERCPREDDAGTIAYDVTVAMLMGTASETEAERCQRALRRYEGLGASATSG